MTTPAVRKSKPRALAPVTLSYFQSAPPDAQAAVVDRFNAKVTPFSDNNGCRHWTGATDKSGYPVFYVGGGLTSARKFAQIIAGREPADFSANSCGCRSCVSPEHAVPFSSAIKRGRSLGRAVMPSRKLPIQ